MDQAQLKYDLSIAQGKTIQAQIESAKATLSTARINLNYTTIRSPVNGTVVARNVDVGQTVAASLQAPTLFTIAQDLEKMQVDTNVDEADIGKVKEGQFSYFTVDAFPGEPFKAKVFQVRNAPTTVQNVVTYDVVLMVRNPDLKLRPGMTANVNIIMEKKDDVLMIPNSVLKFRMPPSMLATMIKGRTDSPNRSQPHTQRHTWSLGSPAWQKSPAGCGSDRQQRREKYRNNGR